MFKNKKSLIKVMKEGKNQSGLMAYLRKVTKTDLTALLWHRQETIKNLRVQLKQRDKETRESIDYIFEQIAESHKYQSFVYVGPTGKVVGSTPTFRKYFHYDDPNKPITGRYFFTALKIPGHAPEYIKDVRERFRAGEQVKLPTTIYDGEGKERFIRFKNYIIPVRVGDTEYNYTRIDVYEIGSVKRVFEDGIVRLKRKLHLMNGEPQNLGEFIQKQITERIKQETKQQVSQMTSELSKEKVKKKKYKKTKLH